MKTNCLKLLFTTALFISLYGCSSDDAAGTKSNNGAGAPSSSLSGSYNIDSMISNLSVDLNNDGISSTDLFMEIDPEFFNSTSPELEIKPVVYNNYIENIMSFYLPHSNITATTPSHQGTVKFTRSGLGYFFEFNSNTQLISVEDSNNSPDPAIYGTMLSVSVVSKGKLKATFKKYYYDFAVAKWVALTITCIYTKS